MSFDLFSQEVDNRIASLRPVREPEPGVFHNFIGGTAKVTMQTFAKAGSAVDLIGSVGPIAQDKLFSKPGTTEAQDKYFKEHEDVFGKAVDYWTPKPNEVGTAGQVVGQLLGTLPMVVASPALAVGTTQVSTAEDLVKKGVDPTKAQQVGAVQAAGLGLGIWVPILGKTLAQRVLLGGAGFNAFQGIATRGASGEILDGTPGAQDFKAFDPTGLTLDVLLGAAFGGLAHAVPSMRAEGDIWHKRMAEWGAKLKPSEIDALVTLRQAQHINADSMPGKPVDMASADAHVQRIRQAIDDLANDRPVNVEQMPAPKFEADPVRQAETAATVKALQDEAVKVAEVKLKAVEAVQPQPAADLPSILSTLEAKYPEMKLDVSDSKGPLIVSRIVFPKEQRGQGFGTEVMRALTDYADATGRQMALTPSKDFGGTVSRLKTFYKDFGFVENIGKNKDFAVSETMLRDPVARSEPMAQKVGAGDTAPIIKESLPVAPEAATRPADTQTAGLDPLAAEAQRFAADNPDLKIAIGKNADGSDITTTPREWLDQAEADLAGAHEDARLFQIAAECLLGAA